MNSGIALSVGLLGLVGACEFDPAALDDAPVISEHDVLTGEDTPVSFALPGVAGTTLGSTPAHGVLRAAPAGWVYHPERDWSGVDVIRFESATVRVTVLAANDRPVALADQVVTAEDTTLVIDPEVLLANDLDCEQADLRVVAVGEPDSGTVELFDGAIRFVPDFDMAGTVRFRYTVSDGEITDTAGVIVEVGAVNDPPFAHTLVTETGEDLALGIKLTADDVDSGRMSFEIVGYPEHGELVVEGSDVVYQPERNFHGSDAFFYVAHDGQATSSTAGVYIDVLSVDECGDLELAAGEQCDDGNFQEGDGCTARCFAE